MKRLTEKEYYNSIKTRFSDEQKKQFDVFLSNIRQFIPEAENIYYVGDDDNLWVMRVEFQRDGIIYQINPVTREKKYQIEAKTDHFKQIDKHDKTRIKEHYSRPNNIGVFTAKKVENWIEYATLVYRDLEKLEEAAQKVENDFLQSLEGENIQWINKRNDTERNGVIRRNGIKFEFTIYPGSIYQKISFDYTVTHNYETFKKLSDNQFK